MEELFPLKPSIEDFDVKILGFNEFIVPGLFTIPIPGMCAIKRCCTTYK